MTCTVGMLHLPGCEMTTGEVLQIPAHSKASITHSECDGLADIVENTCGVSSGETKKMPG